jgi:hypothetical protein
MRTLDNAYALVVGIADYQHVGRLPSVVLEDARAIAGVLTDPQTCGYDPGHVVSLLNEQATKANLQAAFEDAAKRCNADSTFLFYVSGHGGQLGGSRHRGEYLLPVDALYENDRSLARTALPTKELTALFNAIPARRATAIFDCCHSAGIAQPKAAESPAIESGLSERYFRELTMGRGRVVFASCRDSESSYIFPGERNSVFTKHLLAGLRGGAPGPGGLIRIFDLWNYLQPRVVEEARSRQPGRAGQHPNLLCKLEDNFALAMHTGGIGTPVQTAAEKAVTYDAYVSYDPADEDWVGATLVPYLARQCGLNVVTKDSDTSTVGAMKVANIAQGIEHSKRIIVVLSPEFLNNEYTVFETLFATHVGLSQARYRLVPIVYRPCQRLPLLLDALTSVNYPQLGTERALERVCHAVKGPVPEMAFS